MTKSQHTLRSLMTYTILRVMIGCSSLSTAHWTTRNAPEGKSKTRCSPLCTFTITKPRVSATSSSLALYHVAYHSRPSLSPTRSTLLRPCRKAQRCSSFPEASRS